MIRRFARPYARAIMDVIKSPEKANEIRNELARFDEARRASTELQDVYANPGIELNAKVGITQSIAKRLGLSEMSLKILDVLLRNHRINDLGAIVEAVAEMVRQQTGTVAADVRSAHALSDGELDSLRKTLEAKMGKKVEISVATDPALLGGFVAKVGSEIYDASVIGKINKFRESLA
jgi:F-type H+-transporting ATPase subunit delta